MAATAFSLIGRISMQGISASLKEVDGLEASVKKLQKELGQLGKSLNQVGGFLTKNLTLPLAAAGAALGALAVKTGEYAGELSTLHQETGMSTDALQEFAHVAKAAGGDANGFFAAVTALQNKLPDLAKGTGDASKALSDLGVRVTDANGNYRDMNVLFPEIIKKLQGIDDITKRNTLATEIFGKKSKELASFMGMSSDEMGRLRQEAHSMGLVMDGEALKSADDFRVGVERLKERLAAVGRDLATNLIPVLNETFIPLLENTLIPALKGSADAVGVLAKAFSALPAGLGEVAFGITGIVGALGPLALGIGALSGAVTKAIPVLASLAVAFGAAKAGAGGFLVALKGLAVGVALPMAALAGLVQTIRAVVTGIQAWRDVSDAKRLDKEAAAINNQRNALTATGMAARKAAEEYEKLKGTDAYDPKKMEQLNEEWLNSIVAIRQYNQELQKLPPLTEAEIQAIKKQVMARKEATKETAKAAEGAKELTEYEIAQAKAKAEEEAKLAKQRAKEAAEANKRRIAELDALVGDYEEKYKKLFMTEEELSEHEEELEIKKAVALKASEEQIYAIQQYYNELRQRKAEESEVATLKQIEEANQVWAKKAEARRLEEDGRQLAFMDELYKAELEATKDSWDRQMDIHRYYAQEKLNIKQGIADEQLKLLNKEHQDAVDKAKELGADLTPIHEYYAYERLKIMKDLADEEYRIEKDLTRKAEEETYRKMGLIQKWMDAVHDVAKRAGAVFEQYYKNEENNAKKHYSEKQKEIEDAAKNNIITEEQKNEQLAALKEDQDARLLDIQKKQAARQKALSVFSIVTDTAAAVMRAFKDFGPVVGAIMAGAISALGAAQATLVLTEPEPFYDGGLIRGSPAGINAQIGERNQDELVMPLDRGVEMLADKLDARGSTGDTYTYQVDVHVGTMIADEHGIKQLGRKIREVIVSEDRRTGVA